MRKQKIIIVTEKLGSRSLKALADSLGQALNYKVYRVRPGREKGRSSVRFSRGMDKLSQFQRFAELGVSCPKFTTDVNRLNELNEFKDQKIVARKLLNSSEGKGIEIFSLGDDAPRAPLYTQYVPKKKEFRVHVYAGNVIDVAEKRKRRDHQDERDTQVRNLANGYVFCRDNLEEPAGIRDLAVEACGALGRTQGAVDIIWNAKQNKCYVLEVNAIPGMEGTTLEKYKNAILKDKNLEA